MHLKILHRKKITAVEQIFSAISWPVGLELHGGNRRIGWQGMTQQTCRRGDASRLIAGIRLLGRLAGSRVVQRFISQSFGGRAIPRCTDFLHESRSRVRFKCTSLLAILGIAICF